MLGTTQSAWRKSNTITALAFIGGGLICASYLSVGSTNEQYRTSTDETSSILSTDTLHPASLILNEMPTNTQASLTIPVPPIPLPRKPLVAETVPDMVEVAQTSELGNIGDLLNLLDAEELANQVANPQPAISEPTTPASTEPEPSLDEFLTGLNLDEIIVDSATTEAQPEPDEKPEQLDLPPLDDLRLAKPSAATVDRLPMATPSIKTSTVASAGGTVWNGRFPWTTSSPIAAQNGEPLVNPLTRSSLEQGKPTESASGDGSIPRSFIMSAASEVEPVQASNPEPAQAAEIDQATLVANYGGQVSALIQQGIKYPASLLPDRATGTVELGLVFDTNGKLSNVVMIKSSENNTIDESAVATVRSILFPVPPAGAQPQQLRFGIKMTYTPPPAG